MQQGRAGDRVDKYSDTPNVRNRDSTEPHSKCPATYSKLYCPSCQSDLIKPVRCSGHELPNTYRCWNCESVWDIQEISILPNGRKPFGAGIEGGL